MTNVRWQFEIAKMQIAFPGFEPALKGPYVGFVGRLRGKSGRVYEIRLRTTAIAYPSAPPKVFIVPRVGSNRLSDGSLCVNRRWSPGRDTFAQQVLYAANYLGSRG